MIHRVSSRRLSRDTNARAALIRDLANSLILHEKIKTTLTRAKAIRPVVEKLITKSKEASLVNRRYLIAKLAREASVNKLLELIGPIFKERNGGYTRIVKIPPRRGDSAKMAVLEFVENVSEVAAKRKIEEKRPKTKEPQVTTTKEPTKKKGTKIRDKVL